MKKAVNRYAPSTALIVVVLSVLQATTAYAETLDPDRVTWQLLKYSASKFLISMESRVHHEVLTNRVAMQQLLPVLIDDPVQTVAKRVHKIGIQTDVLGLNSSITLWMNPDTTALQRTSLSTGRKFYFRSLRYHLRGVSSVRKQPGNKAEEGENHLQWRKTSNSYYPIPEAEQALILTEAEALFYILPASGIAEPGESRTVYVYDRKGSVRVDLQVQEGVRLKVDYRKKSATGQQRVAESIDTLRIRIKPHPLHSDAKADFSFLGYKDKIDLFYDPQTGLIVQLSGKADYLGTVDIKLKEAGY